MRKDITRAVLLTAAGFLLLFLIRLSYGYLKYPPGSVIEVPQGNQQQGFSFSGKNYASKRIKGSSGNQAGFEQKYEKIAQLASYSNTFDQDEKKLRAVIKKNGALVQFEKRTGLKKDRRLFLAIGVHPGRFDLLIQDLKKIGKLTSLSVSKNDKTNEYKNLKAQRQALQSSIQSLRRLKGQGGPVKDLVELEAKILETEQKIQKLGVSLGDFDEENEFVTIKFDLHAGGIILRSIGFFYRSKVAFQWSAKYYSLLLIIFFCGTISVLLFSLMIEKLAWVPRVISAMYTSVKNFYTAKAGLDEEKEDKNHPAEKA